jgi:hypothetical protein
MFSAKRMPDEATKPLIVHTILLLKPFMGRLSAGRSSPARLPAAPAPAKALQQADAMHVPGGQRIEAMSQRTAAQGQQADRRPSSTNTAHHQPQTRHSAKASHQITTMAACRKWEKPRSKGVSRPCAMAARTTSPVPPA